jgi:hypothetical protein
VRFAGITRYAFVYGRLPATIAGSQDRERECYAGLRGTLALERDNNNW